MRIRRLHRRLREERGNAVVEFPLIAALVVALGLSLLQLALFLHVRNGLTDIAVQSAYHGALLGNDPSDGLARASELASARFQQLGDVDVEAREHAGVIEIKIHAALPLIGFFGPSNALHVVGHAVDEDAL
ncbi:hypothetical protein [Dermabacter hominis]|uniref:hypothetical protein n=1 Tax=Dermabacter hominis TaxID=36740 RepID=UPI00068FF60A